MARIRFAQEVQAILLGRLTAAGLEYMLKYSGILDLLLLCSPGPYYIYSIKMGCFRKRDSRDAWGPNPNSIQACMRAV